MFFRRKLNLTKEQQDSVVKRIVRGYAPITAVQFVTFRRDTKTGTYLLTITLNHNVNLTTTIGFNNMQRFNDAKSDIGLDPLGTFQVLRRSDKLTDEEVSIDAIEVTYLGD